MAQDIVARGMAGRALGRTTALTGTPSASRYPSLNDFNSANPLYIAHGCGELRYPAYSVESYADAYAAGIRNMEADVSSLQDGGSAVMHDTTVDATTSGTGNVSSFSTDAFKALTIDSDSWFATAYGSRTPVLLQEVLRDYGRKGCLFFPEAKSNNADKIVAALQAANIATDQAVIQAATTSWLAAATAAGYPAMKVYAAGDDAATLLAAGIQWLAIDLSVYSTSTISSFVSAGMKVVPYTATRRIDRDAMLALGCVGVFTDDPEYTAASTPMAGIDKWAAGLWMPGMVAGQSVNSLVEDDRGRFASGGWFGWASVVNTFRSVLQGWTGPIRNGSASGNTVVDVIMKFVSASNYGGLFISAGVTGDRAFANTDGASIFGYRVLFTQAGQLSIDKYIGGSHSALVSTATGYSPANGEEFRLRVNFTPTTVQAQIFTTDGQTLKGTTGSATTEASPLRGLGYVSVCKNNASAMFRSLHIR